MNHTKLINNPETDVPAFAEDVRQGLLAEPKYLASKYFYNEKGDALFRKIMQLPEYYLTRTELQILKQNAASIFKGVQKNSVFRLVELGAGDGMKTKVLLDYLLKNGFDFIYTPIDISENALILLKADMLDTFPGLKIEVLQGEYLNALSDTLFEDDLPSFVLFLGSSIGNFSPESTDLFFKNLYASLKPGDVLLTGWDLQKNPSTILAAYNDSQGVTRAFNLNLLQRINDELGADFELSNFEHYPVYEPETGLAKSFLVAQTSATYFISELDLKVSFRAGEWIFTEISRKYALDDIANIRKKARFQQQNQWTDTNSYFIDTLWTRT